MHTLQICAIMCQSLVTKPRKKMSGLTNYTIHMYKREAAVDRLQHSWPSVRKYRWHLGWDITVPLKCNIFHFWIFLWAHSPCCFMDSNNTECCFISESSTLQWYTVFIGIITCLHNSSLTLTPKQGCFVVFWVFGGVLAQQHLMVQREKVWALWWTFVSLRCIFPSVPGQDRTGLSHSKCPCFFSLEDDAKAQ